MNGKVNRKIIEKLSPNDVVAIRARKLHTKERTRIDYLFSKGIVPKVTTLAWDTNPRELCEIPAACRMATELLKRWPRLVDNEANQWLVIIHGLRSGEMKIFGKADEGTYFTPTASEYK